MNKKILFVCTGNTCRSAMAVYLAADIISKEFPDSGFVFDSAGLAAATGCGATGEAIAVLGEKGIDMKDHYSKDFEERMLDISDYVVVMTQGHKRGLVNSFPTYKDKVFTLGEMSGSGEDINDPFCGSMDIYRKTANLLEKEIYEMLKRLDK